MSRLGRSPYRLEANALAELQRAYLAGTVADTDTPTGERQRKTREHSADVREQLADLRRREREEFTERRDELVTALREDLLEQQERDAGGFARWMLAASRLPGPDEARQAFDLAARAGGRQAAATVALRAVTERWDDVLVEWCGRYGWPRPEADQ